jgi:hypothetical protein
MTAHLADTAAPDYAVQCWCDLRSIYFQFPSTHGPCVISFPRDSIGLAKALDLLKSRHATEGHGTPYVAPPIPYAKSPNVTQEQRASARDILRKKGIIP